MNNFRVFALFVFGAVFGAVGASILVSKKAGEFYQNQYMTSVMDQANVALHINSNRGPKLLKTIETNFPEYAVAIDQNFKEHPQATDALWMIKAYYQRSGKPVPDKMKSILDGLPAKPSSACEARLKELDKELTQKK